MDRWPVQDVVETFPRELSGVTVQWFPCGVGIGRRVRGDSERVDGIGGCRVWRDGCGGVLMSIYPSIPETRMVFDDRDSKARRYAVQVTNLAQNTSFWSKERRCRWLHVRKSRIGHFLPIAERAWPTPMNQRACAPSNIQAQSLHLRQIT